MIFPLVEFTPQTAFVVDIETNALQNPDKLWCVVAKDVVLGDVRSFVFEDGIPNEAFKTWARSVKTWIGHNFLGYDAPNLNSLCGELLVDSEAVVDTLVVSRMVEFDRESKLPKKKHSLEAFGLDFGIEKVGLDLDFTKFDPTIVSRCISDVDINHKVFLRYLKYLKSSLWANALKLEHKAAIYAYELKSNGFYFNIEEARNLKKILKDTLEKLDNDLKTAWKPKSVNLGEVVPRATKHGTISRTNMRWAGEDLSSYTVGSPFCRLEWVEFNPASNKQRVERLNEAGWKPVEKTNGHKDFLKSRDRKNSEKLKHYQTYGWKVNETNLGTLPDDAPKAARTLADRIIVATRVAKLEEWEYVYNHDTHRIHGDFQSIGAWPGRMSHSRPNMANVPSTERRKAHQWHYAGEMRALWTVPNGSLLVGTDADAIHLRIFAHLIDDQDLAKAIHEGKKEDGTSPHWVNAKRLGLRDSNAYAKAKAFIYTWLNGGKGPKIAEILECSIEEANNALTSFERSTPAIARLLTERIPQDAARGYFEGLDGRFVPYTSEHGMMSGYLQHGEAVVMKRGMDIWNTQLRHEKVPYKMVNFVHDEWQTEVTGDRKLAEYVGEVQVRSIVRAGVSLGLKCPLNGNYKVALNWKETH